jgi:hypothetical protein
MAYAAIAEHDGITQGFGSVTRVDLDNADQTDPRRWTQPMEQAAWLHQDHGLVSNYDDSYAWDDQGEFVADLLEFFGSSEPL